jgi:prophage regulatory protein
MLDEDDIVLEPECRRFSGGLHPTTRWRLEQQGKFPRRFKVGDPAAPNGRVGWSRSELKAWRAERMAARASLRGPP